MSGKNSDFSDSPDLVDCILWSIETEENKMIQMIFEKKMTASLYINHYINLYFDNGVHICLYESGEIQLSGANFLQARVSEEKHKFFYNKLITLIEDFSKITIKEFSFGVFDYI
jgi:hypothetical protein